MLEFNPYFRLSAKEALKSPIFDKIRVSEYEEECSIKFRQKFNSGSTFDYETMEDENFTIKDYKRLLKKEVKLIKKNSSLF